ncbi:MAG TPA: sigma factor [Usitatibacter sp.]|jgi:DNA-directed RNA polymerase specialized sigma24 family protein|nr:sigma factor [Usitatibacter sp.]
MATCNEQQQLLRHIAASSTLGDVLYGGHTMRLVSEAEWAGLVHAVAEGSQAALHALYDRAHRPVFALALRITGSRASAEEVTLDVFSDVWRRAYDYHPSSGTVLGWIMNQARSRSLDSVRFDRRQQRFTPARSAGASVQAARWAMEEKKS